MNTKVQSFNFPVDLIERIESLGGENKTATVIDLLNQAICLRQIPEQYRDEMYSACKRAMYDNNEDINPKVSRSLVDGLHI